jgi:hypothetical protein
LGLSTVALPANTLQSLVLNEANTNGSKIVSTGVLAIVVKDPSGCGFETKGTYVCISILVEETHWNI